MILCPAKTRHDPNVVIMLVHHLRHYVILVFRLRTFQRMFIKYHGKGSDVNQLIMFIEYHMYSVYSAIYTSYTSVSQRKSNILCLIYSGWL